MNHPPIRHGTSRPPRGDRLGRCRLFRLGGGGNPQRATEAKWQTESGESVSSALHESAGAKPAPAARIENPAVQPPYWTVLPFVLLLAGIAALPLLPATAHWWESNLHRFYVSAAVAAVTLGYYFFLRTRRCTPSGPRPTGPRPRRPDPTSPRRDVLAAAILGEYGPFILLLLSLYVISGGIRMAGELPASPRTNAAFLAVGAVLASFIGTTGAAMVLIRPLLDANRHRRRVAHTIVFFIFVVCNCGGCLLPTGDPPLFIGYLLGVRFFWTLVLWREWLLVNFLLIALYYLFDRFWHYRREPAEGLDRDRACVHRLRFHGVWPNALLLAGTVACVALLDPGKPLPGTTWHPWIYLREVGAVGADRRIAAFGQPCSPRRQPVSLRADDRSGRPFFRHLPLHAAAAGDSPSTGAAAGTALAGAVFLDHRRPVGRAGQRPDLRSFFRHRPLARRRRGQHRRRGGAAACGHQPRFGFWGAMTYIGNGPNFMVRAIAQRAGVAMPSFFAYMVYSCLLLLPALLLTQLIFLR